MATSENVLLVDLIATALPNNQHATRNAYVYSIVFENNPLDARNMMQEVAPLPHMTETRALLVAMRALLAWCMDPTSASGRRVHSSALNEEAAIPGIAPGLSPGVRHLVVNTTNTNFRSMFLKGAGGATRRGLARNVLAAADRLREAGVRLVVV